MVVINKAGLYLYIYDHNLICKDFYGPALDNVRRTTWIDGSTRIQKSDYDEVACTIGVSMQDLWQEDQTELVTLSKEILAGGRQQVQIDIQERGEWYRCSLAGIKDSSNEHLNSLVMFNTKVTELKKREAEVLASRIAADVSRQSSVQKSQVMHSVISVLIAHLFSFSVTTTSYESCSH